MTEIAYVEDDSSIARMVRTDLEARGFRVTLCATAEEAKRALQRRLPKLVIVDWNLPDADGDSLCRWMREMWPELAILLLTVRGDTSDVVRGFESGADDYVTKPFELEVLLSRVRALLRRVDGTPDRLACDGISLDTARMTVYCEGREVAVNRVEYRILLLLLENRGRTVTRTQLLARIWDSDGNFVNDNTLSVAIKRLREKLNQPKCLKTVRSFGYRMEESV